MEVKTKTFTLPNKQIKIVPIKKATAFIPNPKHQASFLAPNAKNQVCVFRNRNGQFVNVLNNEEKVFFEDLLQRDLSIYNKEDNYWLQYKEELGKEIETLDLSNPMDYMKYKVVLSLPFVAENEEVSKRKATYKYYISDVSEEAHKASLEASLEVEAWALFKDLMHDRTKMINYLKIEHNKKVDEVSTSDEFLISEIKKIIKKDSKSLRNFVAAITDKDFDLKVMIEKAISIGALERIRNRYYLPEGDNIAADTQQMIDYLKDGKNQDVFMKIESRIENSK